MPCRPRSLVFTCAALLMVLSLNPAPADADEGRTRFNPSTHGFNFINDFNNDFVKALDIRTGGLCGGMVYTALDYFHARMSIPRQDYRPANRTTLQSYIYNRQVRSIVPNVGKWANMGLNPDGARNGQLFQQAVTQQFDLLKAKIDAGSPIPLGVHGVDGTTHQILAVGYKRGRSPRDVEIFVYDPNVKNTIIEGSGAGYGLRIDGFGIVTHTHNLIAGFGGAFYNTTAHDAEVFKQPRFEDAASGDYRLGKGSPAINAGDDITLLVASDIDGNTRPLFKAFDIGAYENILPGRSFRVLDWQEKGD